MRFFILFLALWSAATIAVAQSRSVPDPSDPAAPAPELQPRSIFAGYKPFQEQKSDSWTQLNQNVAENPGMSMGDMKDMPGHAMPDTHDGMHDKASDAPSGSHEHDDMAMAEPEARPTPSDSAEGAVIAGTGVVQSVDKANARVKLAHDPIDALGWPKMTMFFRLKDKTLADSVKKGDRIDFTLEKSASGYVISALRKSALGHDMKNMK
ncbi:MAG: copper-binding protein [Betaproteobacteria bacterium]